MRNDFFAHLEKLPLSYFQAHRTGDLMSRATNDLNAVRMMVGPAVMYAADTILGFVAALSLMLSIDARLTLLSLVPLPFVSISVAYFGAQIHSRFEDIQAQLSEVSAVTQEALSGVRVVRAYRQEAAEIERFRQANLEYVRRNRRLIALQGMFFPSMSFLLGLGAMLVLWLGSREVIRGPHHARRVRRVQRLPDDAQLADDRVRLGDEHAAARHGELEADAGSARCRAGDQRRGSRRAPGTQSAGSAGAPSLSGRIRGEIEFRDLVFAYGGTPVLDHVSATIEAGQTVALVGVTGSGQVDADHPAGAAARSAAGDGVHRRRRRARDPARDAPRRDRLRAAGAVSSSRTRSPTTSPSGWTRADAPGKGLSGAGGRAPSRRTGRGPSAAVARRQGRRRISRTATTRWSASAASPCRADRSSGPRSRARHRIDPRILILDDALSAVDTYTEEEILSRLRDVMRQRTSIIVVAPHLDGPRRRPDSRARRRPHRRARHARRVDPAERPLRRAAQEAAARRGAGRLVMTGARDHESPNH